jgi:hypothetical protein
MSKQTAVDWLTPKILGLTIELSKRKISQRTCELEIMKLIEQAKAMEREQIIDAHGLKYYDLNEETVTGEQYYLKTYKGGEQ